MLILSRKRGEVIDIGGQVQVMVVDIRGDKVRLGITAPASVSVHRREITRAIEQNGDRRKIAALAGPPLVDIDESA